MDAMCCECSSGLSSHRGYSRLTLSRCRYFHYVNTATDPLYLDELKLLGWDYINYIDGWPVLSYH